MTKLTALQVAHAKNRGLINDGAGLYLKITDSGTKSWVFRYRQNGRQRYHGLGSVEILSLAEARDAALKCRKMRLAGLDPIEEKKKQKIATQLEEAKAISFQDCAEQYIKAHSSAWRNEKHLAQWKSTLVNYAYPVFGSFPVGDIDAKLVLKAVQPIWQSKNVTASRLRQRIEKVLDYAKVLQYRTGENPAIWKGNMSHMLPPRNKVNSVKHFAALPHAQLPIFWEALSKQSGMGAEALRFVILTAARTGEVLGATWNEIDWDNIIWIIPADRMKAGSEHRVPLSDPVLEILKTAKKQRKGDLGV